MRKLFHKRYYLSVWLIVFTISIIYMEYLSYNLNTYQWLEPKCDKRDECTKVLLVADPQIIGKYQELLRHITPLTIFDSDLYLKRTYKLAHDFIKPDIVIFLGDIMDEGSKSDDKEFYEYVRRIFNIFLEDAVTSTKYIWLPGDNDIGGEDAEAVSNYKMKRFERAFRQPDIITFKNVTFLKINRLVQTIPIFKEKREFYDSRRIFVGVSHYPLIFMPSLFVDKVLDRLLPHVMFTGHEHKSMIVTTDALSRHDRQIVPVRPDNNRIYEFPLGISDMYEFIVPTCSYRMGTDKIGYGYAIIEKNRIRYTVLWSPSRFEQLKYYFVLVLCFVTLCFFRWWCTRTVYKRIV